MKDAPKENRKKSLEIGLPEESWEQLRAKANGQQKSLETIVEEALTAYLKPRNKDAADDRINPIEDTEPAKSWGYNSDVRGK